MAIREDLVQTAVQFLNNPQVQSSPLEKKTQFLKTKGLTQEEIDEAISRTSGKSSSSSSSSSPSPASLPSSAPAAYPPQSYPTQPYPAQPGYPPQPGYYYPPPPASAPPPPPSGMFGSVTWKDAFIGLVLAGGAAYVGFSSLKKYIAPALQWPSKSELEGEKKEIEEKFKTTTQTLAKVDEHTSAGLSTLQVQNNEVRENLGEIEKLLKEVQKGCRDQQKEVDSLKEGIETIKEMIPKIIEKTKEDQKSAISDLNSELKSLKSLLLNRTAIPSSSSSSALPSALAPSNISRAPSVPSIPSWQRADSTTTSSSSGSSLPGSSPSKPVIPSWQLANTSPAPAPTPSASSSSSPKIVELGKEEKADGEAAEPSSVQADA